MKRNLHLLVIDPQNDFCDLPPKDLPKPSAEAAPCAPALPVSGAHNDMQRLSEAILVGLSGVSGITVTLDSHHHVGIERPAFWKQADGAPVAPFTPITAAQVRAGQYLPRDPAALPRTLTYLDALEAAGRYHLMVWTTHCEIGTWGHNVHAELRTAYNEWERRRVGIVAKIGKGSNPWTEHYSALAAEVPDPADPATQLNRDLIERLSAPDLLFIAGEAGSHCVKATVEDLVANLPPDRLGRIVLVEDCISPVTGFEAEYAQFLSRMAGLGVQRASANDLRAELLANV